jgi:nicotinate-nucleotide adenylyltransferase
MQVIFGGTFDPVHNGHLRTAVELRERLQVATLSLVPCHLPPHRGEPGAPSAMRQTMLEPAVRDEPALRVDGRELARDEPSYTVDTLADIRAGMKPGMPLAMVVGTDTFAAIDRWDRWQQLLDLAHIIVIHRPGHRVPANSVAAQLLADNERVDAQILRSTASGCVWQVALPALEISASAIREKVREGLSPRYLLPDAVWYLITEAGLYRR